MRLLLLGCTGFVGRELVSLLLEHGHACTVVSRQGAPLAALRHPSLERIQADPAAAESWQRPDLLAALAAAEGVVNLAGEPIAEKRWSDAQLELLTTSRIATTRHLVAAMERQATPPRVLVSGSAVGYYGRGEGGPWAEDAPAADDVLGRLCLGWEAAAHAADPFCRVVILRIGIVLGPDGGALGKMLPVFRAGFGGPIGTGRQWMSWIHRTDLCRLVASALEDTGFQGVYNAVAPEPVSMAAFAGVLGKVLHRPSLLPVPAPVLQLLLGDGAQVVLEGQRVAPRRLQEQGFSFRYPQLSAALAAATSPAPR